MKLFASVALAALLACPAWAQRQNCGPRPDVVQMLENKYGESRQGIGFSRQGGVIEIYANIETGSWTILISLATGLSCISHVGQGYENLTEPAVEGDPV